MIVRSILEVVIAILIVLGFFFEDKVADFESAVIEKVKDFFYRHVRRGTYSERIA